MLTALVWASAVIMFKRSGERVHPVALNSFKNLLAWVLLIPTAWIMGESLLRSVPASEYIMLIISGALGIGISDTLFFKSLNRLGAGLSAIVDCLYSPSIIFLSMLWLGETLTWLQIMGAVMIVSAVLTAIGEKNGNHLSRSDMFWGVTWGASAMLIMAVSIVSIKPILSNAPLLWVTEIRLTGGILSLLVVLAFHPSRRKIIGSMKKTNRWTYTILGSFTGAYVSMMLWLGGMKYANVSIAAALNQTSNIWIYIFAGLFLKETLTRGKTIGIILGVAGTLLVTYG